MLKISCLFFVVLLMITNVEMGRRKYSSHTCFEKLTKRFTSSCNVYNYEHPDNKIRMDICIWKKFKLIIEGDDENIHASEFIENFRSTAGRLPPLAFRQRAEKCGKQGESIKGLLSKVSHFNRCIKSGPKIGWRYDC